MAKTYRKRQGEDFWHFCSTCPHWPTLELMDVTARDLAKKTNVPTV